MTIGQHAMPPRACRRQRGFALIFVLWAVVFLTLIAGNYVLNVRAESAMVNNAVESARAGALAEAAIQHGILSLLSQSPADARLQAARKYEEPFGDGTIRVSIVPESAKIDLNTGPEPLLSKLLEGMSGMEDGPNVEERERAVAAILDWRDRDARVRPQGAEDSAYGTAGLQFDAADNAFLMVEELRRVLGVDERIYSFMRPLVTVNSRQAKVHAASASRSVLLALPGVSEADVDDYLAERAQPESERPARRVAPQLEAARAYISPAARPIYTVSGEGQTAGGAKARRSVVVRVTRNKKRPYLIMDWSDDVDESVFQDTVPAIDSDPSAAGWRGS